MKCNVQETEFLFSPVDSLERALFAENAFNPHTTIYLFRHSHHHARVFCNGNRETIPACIKREGIIRVV